MAKIQNGSGQPPKKPSLTGMKPVSTLKREVTTVTKGPNGSTTTVYPKRVSADGVSSQLTKTTVLVKKKK